MNPVRLHNLRPRVAIDNNFAFRNFWTVIDCFTGLVDTNVSTETEKLDSIQLGKLASIFVIFSNMRFVSGV